MENETFSGTPVFSIFVSKHRRLPKCRRGVVCKGHRDDGSVSRRKFYFYCVAQAATKPDASDNWVPLSQTDKNWNTKRKVNTVRWQNRHKAASCCTSAYSHYVNVKNARSLTESSSLCLCLVKSLSCRDHRNKDHMSRDSLLNTHYITESFKINLQLLWRVFKKLI